PPPPPPRCNAKDCRGAVAIGELRLVSGKRDRPKHIHLRCVGPLLGRAIQEAGGVAHAAGFADLSEAQKEEATAAVLAASRKPKYENQFSRKSSKKPAAKEIADGSSDEDDDWEQQRSVWEKPRATSKRHRAAPAATQQLALVPALQPLAALELGPGPVPSLVQQMADAHSAMLKLYQDDKVPFEGLQQSMALVSQAIAFASKP
ncbi:hypothetical protein TeGR_g4305, partial [Tetraparma gracilis]